MIKFILNSFLFLIIFLSVIFYRSEMLEHKSIKNNFDCYSFDRQENIDYCLDFGKRKSGF